MSPGRCGFRFRPASESMDSRSSNVRRWFAGAHGWVAPMVALLAVGMHYALNVPSEALLATTRKEPAPDPPPVEAKPSPVKAKTKSKGKTKSDEWTPRAAPELARLRKQFLGTPISNEPETAAWARKAQAVVGKAIMLARTEAFAGAPEDPRIVTDDARCHTIRCLVVLRSPYPHELRLILDALPKVR